MTILAVATMEVDTVTPAYGSYTLSTSAALFDSAYAAGAAPALINNTELTIPFTASSADFWLHYSVYVDFNPNINNTIWQLSSNTGPELRGRVVSGPAVIVEKTTNGSAWTQVGSGNVPMVQDVREVWDFHVILGASGRLDIYKNGSRVFTFTGDVTTQTDTSNLMRFVGGASNSIDFYISEFIAATEATIDWRLDSKRPNAAGAFSAWSGAYTDVDEVQLDAGDVNATNTDANQFTFNTADFTAGNLGARVIKAVALFSRGAVTPDATVNDFQHMTRISGNNFFSSNLGHVKDGGLRAKTTIWETNPNTSAAWTLSEANGAEFGYKAVT